MITSSFNAIFASVSLTKTASKGKSQKAKLIESLREALDDYTFVYVLRYENMRSVLFRDVRMDWKESKYVLHNRTPKKHDTNIFLAAGYF